MNVDMDDREQLVETTRCNPHKKQVRRWNLQVRDLDGNITISLDELG